MKWYELKWRSFLHSLRQWMDLLRDPRVHESESQSVNSERVTDWVTRCRESINLAVEHSVGRRAGRYVSMSAYSQPLLDSSSSSSFPFRHTTVQRDWLVSMCSVGLWLSPKSILEKVHVEDLFWARSGSHCAAVYQSCLCWVDMGEGFCGWYYIVFHYLTLWGWGSDGIGFLSNVTISYITTIFYYAYLRVIRTLTVFKKSIITEGPSTISRL